MTHGDRVPAAANDEPRFKVLPRLRRLFAYAWPYRVQMVLAGVCLLVSSGLVLLFPLIFGKITDAAFTTHDTHALNVYTATIVVLVVINAAFMFFRYYLFTWVGERVVADLRVELYRHLVRLSQAFFHRKRTGELLSRLAEDVAKVQGTVSSEVSLAARNLVTLAGGLVILFLISVKLTLIMLAVVPPLVITARVFGQRIRRLAREVQDELALANAELGEGIAGIETVQAFGREPFEVDRYGDSVGRAFGLSIRRALAGSWFMSIASLVAFSAIAGLAWFGGTMGAKGEIQSGDLVQFMLYTVLVAGAVGGMANTWTNLQSALGATARLFEILDTRPEIESRPGAVALAPTSILGELRFEHVSFAYGDRDAVVVRDIDLHIRPGQSCALVGSSGSGKTTLSRLALRFYDPQEGRITLDGHDLRDLDVHALRGAMAVVSQDPMLFSGTIADNIRYGRLDATPEEIEHAAVLANAHAFIEAFPDGFATRVGERGVQLSGGQRQRISIARAILRDPKVLVLDEATSALDAQSEGIVQEALEKLQKGRTTIIIAHRLSTIFNADRIVMLEGGRIVEEGRHDELMARGGPYARLVARQAAAMVESPVRDAAAV